MKLIGVLLAFVCAVVLHVGFLFFGGLLFADPKKDQGTLQQVELVSADESVEKDKKKDEPKDPTPEEAQELEAETEQPPDAAEMMRNLELSEAASAPALEAASLSAIEAALNGQGGGGGDFAQSLDFSSGGRIGGTGKPGALDGNVEGAFSLAEIDQKPRAISQPAPMYPADMRSKKLEGVVTVVFVVDAAGNVSSPRVENSSHSSFDKPALDAVKKWKFEPALRSGRRVACKMRVPIRFQPN